MVKIRYSDLPVGLHVTAVAVGRQTIVYLLPGLTATERKSALLRVRSSARVGHGPSLSPFALAKALAADRLRAVTHTVGAAMRRHPVLLVPFTALVLSVTVLVVVVGTAGATPGRLAGPQPRAGVTSPPASWHRVARHPEPLSWKHYRQRIRPGGDQHASRHRGAASHRTSALPSRRGHDLTSVRRPRVSAAFGHHLAARSGGRSSSRHHRARHRWRRPVPYHVGIPAAGGTLSHAGARW
jgi:hypothetical protein